MSNFSLKWFRSERDKELERLKVEEQRIKNDLLRKQLLYPAEEFNRVPLTRSVKLVNDTLTIVMMDGSVLMKAGATVNDFNTVRNAISEVQIMSVLEDQVVSDKMEKQAKEVEKVKRILDGMEILKLFSDFEIKENCVYFKGINRTIPALLVKKLAELAARYQREKDLYKNVEYIALKRFFMWCCLNPRAEVADKLYDFLEKNGMQITKQGFFVALRNVVDASNKDSEIVHFISNAYNKVKGVWKKKPEDYRVVQNGADYSIEKVTSSPTGTIIGNLHTLYLDLPNMRENRFTDNYTHTYDIRIGKVVSMPKEECSWSTRDCAEAGLHFAGCTAPYVLCGDTTVFTLHNPMKVVGIGVEKGRCYEYLPFMTTTVKEADEIMNSGDFDFLEMDEAYAIHELEDLENKVKDGFSVEAKKHKFNLPTISSIEVKTIIKSLDEMKSEISSRVVKID